MSDEDPEDLEEMRRSEEAASIFQRLDENPDDLEAQKDRDAFLARGDAERATYRNLLRFLGTVQKIQKPKPKTPPNLIIFVVLALGTVLYVLFEPLSIYLIADEMTGNETKSITLASGDVVILDGSSAITETVNEQVRQVDLLSGAAYFQVTRNARPFIVNVQDVVVTVVGTTFEVSKFHNEVTVSVVEGSVEVAIDGEPLMLGAGQSIRWREGRAPIINETEIAHIGSWRNNTLVTDGMTLGEVVQVIDRRLPGPVFVIGDDLASKTFRGQLDLTAPLVALDALAVTTNAKVRSVAPVATIVSER